VATRGPGPGQAGYIPWPRHGQRKTTGSLTFHDSPYPESVYQAMRDMVASSAQVSRAVSKLAVDDLDLAVVRRSEKASLSIASEHLVATRRFREGP